jgi:hypothetical protein
MRDHLTKKVIYLSVGHQHCVALTLRIVKAGRETIGHDKADQSLTVQGEGGLASSAQLNLSRIGYNQSVLMEGRGDQNHKSALAHANFPSVDKGCQRPGGVLCEIHSTRKKVSVAHG